MIETISKSNSCFRAALGNKSFQHSAWKDTALIITALASTLLSACGEDPRNSIADDSSDTAAAGGLLGGYLTPAEHLGYPYGTVLAHSVANDICQPSRDDEQPGDYLGLVYSNLRCTNEYQPGRPINCFFSVENRSDTVTERISTQLSLMHAQTSNIEIGSCEIPPIPAKTHQNISCLIANVPSVKVGFNEKFHWDISHPKIYRGSSSNYSDVTIGPIFLNERVLISDGNCTVTSQVDLDDDYNANCHFTVSNVGAVPTNAVIQFSIDQQPVTFSDRILFECPVPEIPVGGTAEVDCLAPSKVNPRALVRITAIARISATPSHAFNWQQILAVTDEGNDTDVPLSMDCSKGVYLAKEPLDCLISFSNASKQAKAAETISITTPFQSLPINLHTTLHPTTFECHLPARAAGETVLVICQGRISSYDAYPLLSFDIGGGFDKYCIVSQDFGLKLLAGKFASPSDPSTTLYLTNVSKEESSPDAYIWLHDIISSATEPLKVMIPPTAPGENIELKVDGPLWDEARLGEYMATDIFSQPPPFDVP